jgi:hypothetical protein
MRFFFLVFTCLFVVACRNKPTPPPPKIETDQTITIPFGERHTVSLLGLNDAQNMIITDSITPYFEQLTPLDIAMQMQDSDLQGLKKDSLLPIYKTFLQQHVSYFSATERDSLLKYTRQVFKVLEKINPDLMPQKLCFMKTDDNIYGGMTYFTRNNCIVIPQTALKNALKGDTLRFRNTIAHEIFHVVSRYQPQIATQLYARIGFDTIQHLRFTDTLLEQRILNNPDGTQPYKIRLSDTLMGVMLSAAESKNFDDSEPFEAHLNWDMYAIKKKRGAWLVQSDSLGESTLSNTWEVPFFKKTTANTEYTLHPDEMIAENFVLLFRSKIEPKPLEIDADGKRLLYDIERILKQSKYKKMTPI